MKSSVLILLLFSAAFGAAGEPPDGWSRFGFTEEERAWLLENPALRVVSDAEWAPFEYRDRDGRFRGLSVDYLELVAGTLGLRLEYPGPRDWRSLMEDFRAGSYDIASAVVVTPSRAEWLAFTSPFFTFRYVVFGQLASPYVDWPSGLAGARILVAAGYGIEDHLRRDHPELNLVAVPNTEAAVDELSRGKADYFIGDIASTGWYLQKLGVANLKVTGDTPYQFELVMGVGKDKPLLVSILDKVLRRMPEDQIAAIRREWFSAQAPRGPDYRLMIVLAVIAASLAGGALAWSRVLAARVRARTAELAAALEERGVLLAELNHRVKNNLQLALSLVRLSSESAAGSEKAALDGAAGRLEAITQVHEALAPKDAVKDLKVDLGEYLERLAAGERALGAGDGAVSLETGFPSGVRVSMKTAANVGLVVNELITNARKYAFPAGRRGTVRILMRRRGPDGAEVEVSDDGIGMGGVPRADSLGLSLVRSIVDSYGAELECETAPEVGTSWRFTIPTGD